MKRFQDCCKKVIWSKIATQEICAVPGYEEIIGKKLEECTSFSPAIRSNAIIFKNITNVLSSPHGNQLLPLFRKKSHWTKTLVTQKDRNKAF